MMNKESKYINVKGQLMDLSEPRVMGILNVTPDSFYSESRLQTVEKIAARVVEIVNEGADFIDIGAYSSRPNADHVSLEEEMNRLRMGLEVITDVCPSIPISVDTFRADAARMCVEEYGAALINDISAGEMDSEMFSTVAGLGVPYIIMHMKGTPQTMQQAPHYDNLMKEIFRYFARKIHQLYELGVKDLILDPGFGFGKTLEHNYGLMGCLEDFALFDLPVLVGISRKSMIYRTLGTTPDEALAGTVALGWECLRQGASILRVHDVREAVDTVRLFRAFAGRGV